MSHKSSAARRPRVNQPLCERRLPHRAPRSLTTTIQKSHSLSGQIVRLAWAKLLNAIPYWLHPQFLHFDTEWSGVSGWDQRPVLPLVVARLCLVVALRCLGIESWRSPIPRGLKSLGSISPSNASSVTSYLRAFVSSRSGAPHIGTTFSFACYLAVITVHSQFTELWSSHHLLYTLCNQNVWPALRIYLATTQPWIPTCSTSPVDQNCYAKHCPTRSTFLPVPATISHLPNTNTA
jgi:hypothetical protein